MRGELAYAAPTLKKNNRVIHSRKAADSYAPNRVKTVVAIVLSFLLAFMICYRYTIISNQVAQQDKLEQELRELEARNLQISMEIERSIDLKSIEEYATNVLGMVKPQRYQIIYITPNGRDEMQNVAKNPKNDTSVYGVISGSFDE
jgi:cell division protein FtsB